MIKKENPMRVRYLLHIHRNGVDVAVANRLADLFNRSPGFAVIKGKRKHHQFEVMREPEGR